MCRFPNKNRPWVGKNLARACIAKGEGSPIYSVGEMVTVSGSPRRSRALPPFRATAM